MKEKAEHAHETQTDLDSKLCLKVAQMFQLPLQMESILHKGVKLGST